MARQVGGSGRWPGGPRRVQLWAKAVAGVLAASLVASLAVVTTEGNPTSKDPLAASRSTAATTLSAGISSSLLGGALPQSTPGVSQSHPSAAAANLGAKAASQITPTDRPAPDSPIIGAALGDGAKVAASVLASGTKPNPGPPAAATALPPKSATTSFTRNANGSITASVANGPVDFPISIDPVYSTTTAASGGYDDYVNSDNCTGAYSTQTQLRVGSPGIDHEACADPLAPYAYNPSQYSRSRAILDFNLASITGDNHVVTNATLNLYAYAQGSTSYPYNVYALAQAPSASTDWANQPSTAGIYESDQALSGTGAYSSINLTSLVNAWVNTDFSGTIANDGLELRAYGASGGDEYAPGQL